MATLAALAILAQATGPAAAGHPLALYDFQNRDHAWGAVYVDASGNLFGTTGGGGSHGMGSVYRVAPDGTETVLHSFANGRDGKNPAGGVAGDSAGNIYGTAMAGGSRYGGVAFKLTPDGKFSVLHAFAAKGPWSPSKDGNTPWGSIARDAAGNLYGTTRSGGASGLYGTVYKLAPDGTETILHDFLGSEGAAPRGLVLADDGTLYGTTQIGGSIGGGVAYKIAPDGTYTLIHSFDAQSEGYLPQGEVALDKNGNIFGANWYGGSAGEGEHAVGTAWRLAPDGGFTLLHTFIAGRQDGAHPVGRVALDASGNLYGVTFDGGKTNYPHCNDMTGCGVLYRIAPGGSEKILHHFDGLSAGGDPYGGLSDDGHGRLFGTTLSGGAGSGVVFEVDE